MLRRTNTPADTQSQDLSLDILESDQEDDEQSPCGKSTLLVNGQRLHQHWFSSDLSPQGSSSLAIDAEGSVSQAEHSLLLSTSSICERDSVQVTSITITEIDGTAVHATCGLTVSHDQYSHRIITVGPLVDDELSAPIMSGLVKQEDLKTETTSLIQVEVKRLRTLESDLKELTSAVERQQKLVDDLAASEKHQTTQELSECDDIKCFVKTIANKASGCIHILLLRYGPHQEAEAFSREHDCVWPEGRAARLQVLMSGKPLCLSPPDSDAGRQSADMHSTHKSSGDSSSSSSSFTTSTLSVDLPENLRREHRFHIFLGTVLSLLCLSCFSVCLHRRCCDPRRRVERAARREERARRKEYRRLTRCKAWKDWWNVRIRRNNTGASTDYEEKRSLILAQEAVLERAMQNEIRILRSVHTGVSDLVSAAEEGRAYQSDGEDSLPAYRSRAGSGRPPSYNEVDVHGRVVIYTPSTSDDSVLEQYEAAAAAAQVDDTTPDSSVANLSPRNSSETLRTERSIV